MDDDLAEFAIKRRFRRRQHVLRRLWWSIFGIPDVDELRVRYGERAFTDEEEERIRELIREELNQEKDIDM